MIDAQELKKHIQIEAFYRDSLGEPSAKTAASSIFFCPFHDDRKTPNLTVFSDGGFKCFACNESGDVIDFHMKRNTLDFPAAVQELAGKYAPHLLNGNGGKPKAEKKIIARYDYKDKTGNSIFQVVRFDPKDFRQGRYDSAGGWIWNLSGVELVPYRLPELITSTGTVYICEGEKDCDRLVAEGLIATTCAGGAGKWKPEFNEYLKDRDVVILMDNDEAGQKHGDKTAQSLARIAKSIKLVPFDELPEHGDVSDYLQTHSIEDLLAKVEQTPLFIPSKSECLSDVVPETDLSDHWEAPVLFGEIETPEIPSKLLPAWVRDCAEAVSLDTQTPSGMSVMESISVLATSLQKKYEVSPFGGDYKEPVSLWTVTALPPASRKTAVVNSLTSPLNDWEKERAVKLEPLIAINKTKRIVIQKRLDILQSNAAKEDDPSKRDSLISEIGLLERQIPKEIRAPRLWTSDCTPERLQGLLVEHDEKMACLSDEGGIFEVMAGLYSDGKTNIDVFLQGHAGSPVRVDRGARTAYLSKPAFTFGLAIQPAVLKSLSQGNKKRVLPGFV